MFHSTPLVNVCVNIYILYMKKSLIQGKTLASVVTKVSQLALQANQFSGHLYPNFLYDLYSRFCADSNSCAQNQP